MTELEHRATVELDVARDRRRSTCCASHGYCVVRVTPHELTAQFKPPRTIARPASPVDTIAWFRVTWGVPNLEVI